jgi:predicted molibdopterin-dependent oxidoreductase YjgC
MRIETIPKGEQVTLRVNGKAVAAHRGETVHAALLAAGFRVLRKSKTGAEFRGFLCGMGTCYECLVTINGLASRRACMHLVEDGMEVWIDDPDL